MWPWEIGKPKKIPQELNIKEVEIIDYLTDGILVLDKDKRIFLANKSIEKFLDVSKDSLPGKSFFWLDRFADLSAIVSFSPDKIETKDVNLKETLIARITIIPIAPQGETIGFLLVFHNITKEKLVEKAKSDFVSLATHQLWTPTSGIKWSLKMLLDGEFGKLSPEQKEIIKKLYETNDREIKLVEDLLQVAKIEEGKFLSDFKMTDIEHLIKNILNDYTQQIKEKGLKISFKKDKGSDYKTIVDQSKIRIAISNIIDNAIKYTPENGQIKIFLEKGKEKIKIKISDNGFGIPKNEQARVFTKFFRASNIIQKDTLGTGLGLYMTKNIIEAHGGSIWFESDGINKGTSFYIFLPIKKNFGEFIDNRFY